MRARSPWILLLLVFGSANASESVDVNDVSYLWPPALTVADADRLIPLSGIIDTQLFSEIIALSKGEGPRGSELPVPVSMPEAVGRIESWRLAAMRIDPCAPAPGLDPGTRNLHKCIQEVRLVVQPFAIKNGVFEYYDFAFHIIFEMGTGNPLRSAPFKRLWGELRRLKNRNAELGIETAGMPLRIHPGFRDGTFRASLQSVLFSHLRTSRLKKITFVGAATEEGPWLFFQGLISKGTFVPENDPTLRNQPFGSVMPAMPGEGGVFIPTPSNSNWPTPFDRGLGPSIIDLFSTGTLDLNQPATLPNLEESKVFRRKDLVHAIHNPNITNRTNTDCFSCHTSMSRGLLLELSSEENPFKFQAPNNHVTVKSVFSSDSMVNFRAFGWFGSRPVVSDRVINESALTADLVEELFQTPTGL